jgi:LEA14-like dessication related protein
MKELQPWSARVTALLSTVLFLAGCASLRTPTLQVEKLDMAGVRLTGAGMDVAFRVRNPNPEPLLIERFEYELKLNGRRLGRGYYPDALELRGFEDASVVSRFDLNFFSLPSSVKRIFDRDRVDAEVKGTFYVQQPGQSPRELKFKSKARVNVGR